MLSELCQQKKTLLAFRYIHFPAQSKQGSAATVCPLLITTIKQKPERYGLYNLKKKIRLYILKCIWQHFFCCNSTKFKMLFQNTLHLGHTAFFFLTKPFLLCKCSYSRVEIVFWNFKTPKSHIDELDGFLAPPPPREALACSEFPLCSVRRVVWILKSGEISTKAA